MKVDYSPRHSGKTTRMLEWLREEKHRLLITFDFKERERLRKLIEKDMIFVGRSRIKSNKHEAHNNRIEALTRRVLTQQDYIDKKQNNATGKLNIRGWEIGIDNADIFIQNMFWDHVSEISISQDPSKYV